MPKTARKAKRKPRAKRAPAETPWSHATRQRCPRCGAMMRADGTKQGGRIKRWKCPAPICRKMLETAGTPV